MYVFDNAAPQAAARLAALASVFDQGSRRHLCDRGVADGWRCLEIGGGLGTMTRWLAERVGPAGSILTTDIDTRHLQQLRLANVEVREHDVVTNPLPAGVFDLALARLVLEHLPDPDVAITNMIGAVRPGGWVVVEDFELLPGVAAEEHGLADRISKTMAAMRRVSAAAGAHQRLGRSLAGRLRTLGLTNVDTEGRVHLVKALGVDGISKSEVSRICAELDTTVAAFRTRPLTGEHRYLWVDATYHKVRVDGHVISQATVVAIGVTTGGERQVLGLDVGPSEDRAFWTAFLRSLVKRGLKGVRVVISDAHEGLKQALSTVLSGTAWQRCRVHFMRNLLATVPHGAREAIAAIVRTIFAQPDHASALTQLRKIADGLRSRVPRAAVLLEEAAEDILAYRHLPIEHQRQLHSTNPLERLNKEIKRRSNVVGIFPNPAAVIRLVGAILLEQDDEWTVAERRYFSADSMTQLTTPTLSTTAQEILAAIA